MRRMAFIVVACLGGLGIILWAHEKSKGDPASSVKELQGLMEEFATLQKG